MAWVSRINSGPYHAGSFEQELAVGRCDLPVASAPFPTSKSKMRCKAVVEALSVCLGKQIGDEVAEPAVSRIRVVTGVPMLPHGESFNGHRARQYLSLIHI